jgi:hypothetical protein
LKQKTDYFEDKIFLAGIIMEINFCHVELFDGDRQCLIVSRLVTLLFSNQIKTAFTWNTYRTFFRYLYMFGLTRLTAGGFVKCYLIIGLCLFARLGFAQQECVNLFKSNFSRATVVDIQNGVSSISSETQLILRIVRTVPVLDDLMMKDLMGSIGNEPYFKQQLDKAGIKELILFLRLPENTQKETKALIAEFILANGQKLKPVIDPEVITQELIQTNTNSFGRNDNLIYQIQLIRRQGNLSADYKTSEIYKIIKDDVQLQKQFSFEETVYLSKNLGESNYQNEPNAVKYFYNLMLHKKWDVIKARPLDAKYILFATRYNLMSELDTLRILPSERENVLDIIKQDPYLSRVVERPADQGLLLDTLIQEHDNLSKLYDEDKDNKFNEIVNRFFSLYRL